MKPSEATARTVRIPVDHWIEVGTLILLGRTDAPSCLYDRDGELVAWIGAENPEDCPGRLVTEAECVPVLYPWDLMRINEQVVAMMDESSIQGEVSPLATINGHLRLGPGAKILPGAVIEGNVVIGANTRVGPNCYIRGNTSIGSNCFIGNGVEIKNSIIYPNTNIARQCYVGDSIIGSHVTLGAGTATENHRNDGRPHTSTIKGKPVNTYRVKLGAMIGDGVRTGVNTSLGAAIKIGIARTVSPGTYVDKDLM